MRSGFFIIGYFLFTLAGLTDAMAAERYNLPYAKPVFNQTAASEAKFTCPRLPSDPMRDLVFTSVYNKNDPERDNADPENLALYRGQTEPIARLENRLLQLTNSYYVSPPAIMAPKARCALRWLFSWAESQAMLGRVNRVGISVRHWALASFASGYGQIRDEPSLDPKVKSAVAEWLRANAYAVIADYDAPENKRVNNLSYWAGWGVAITGAALDDKALFNWGIKRGYAGVMEISSDGTLPLEITRGSRALLYHQFALAPLIMIAELAYANGYNLYAANDGRLHRLARRVLMGTESSAYFETKTGHKQDSLLSVSEGQMAWVEVYHARFHSQRTRAVLETYRPLISRRLGGNMTLLFKKEP